MQLCTAHSTPRPIFIFQTLRVRKFGCTRREVFEETGFDTDRFELTDWRKENRYEIYLRWRGRYAPGITHNTEHVFGLRLPRILPVTLAAREHLQYAGLLRAG